MPASQDSQNCTRGKTPNIKHNNNNKKKKQQIEECVRLKHLAERRGALGFGGSKDECWQRRVEAPRVGLNHFIDRSIDRLID